jgi:predicted metal-binding membrane protein
MGGLLMGLHHGLFCIGCCWLLMALLFVVGVMNLVWIAALTAVVLLEKLVPRGESIARIAGLGIVAWGVYLLLGSDLPH